MSTSILVAYATRYGSTKEVAEAIAETLRQAGAQVELQPLSEVRSLAGFQAVVMGAPLQMYRWHKDAFSFLSRHHKALAGIPVAVFALGPVQNPHNEAEWQGSRDQLAKELAKVEWFKPLTVEILGGKFDPQALGGLMKMFAKSEPATDIRDWEAIRQWAQGLLPLFSKVD